MVVDNPCIIKGNFEDDIKEIIFPPNLVMKKNNQEIQVIKKINKVEFGVINLIKRKNGWENGKSKQNKSSGHGVDLFEVVVRHTQFMGVRIVNLFPGVVEKIVLKRVPNIG